MPALSYGIIRGEPDRRVPRLHPDALSQRLADERVRAPDQFGELFVGVAERFDR